MTSPAIAPPRLASLDQFRGYTVAGMCLVNFLAPFAAIHSIFKHNDTYFSYADTIMPGFLFIVGFAFRLTYLKRRRNHGTLPTAGSYLRRSGKLLLLSLLIYVFVGDLFRWFEFREMPPEFGREKSAEQRGISGPPASEGPLLTPHSERTRVTSAIASGAPRPASIRSPLIAGDSELVSAAIARLRAWRKLDGAARLLVHWRILAARLIKSELWETLAIIGATQVVVLPWIGCRFWTRLIVMAALGLTHCLISYWFNWEFLYGVNGNWMSQIWMTGDDRGWDGGIFGPLNWAVVMLGGTLAYDLVASTTARNAAVAKLALWALVFMTAGYCLSCVTRLYDLSATELAEMRERHLRQDGEKARLDEEIRRQRTRLETLRQSTADDRRLETSGRVPSGGSETAREQLEGVVVALEDLRRGYPDLSLAESPVWPPWERLHDRTIGDLLAEPPFVAPPADDTRIDSPPCIEHRLRNYWMLGKRMPNLSFVTFATGFQFAIFGLFLAACDIGGLRLGVFRTLGTNPLAAYFIHGMMALVLALTVPHDAALGFCLAGFGAAFAMTYLLVRLLEKRGLYWRL